MALIIALFLSFCEPAVSFENALIPCYVDSECGQGQCWTGVCAETGYCIAYSNCV